LGDTKQSNFFFETTRFVTDNVTFPDGTLHQLRSEPNSSIIFYVLILNFLHRIVFKSNTHRTFLLQLFVWFLRIFSRLEFLSDKSRLGSGKKRNIHFQTGPSDEETISSAGFLNSDLIVKIAPGLPNTSSEYFCFIFNHFSQVILIIFLWWDCLRLVSSYLLTLKCLQGKSYLHIFISNGIQVLKLPIQYLEINTSRCLINWLSFHTV